MFVGQGLNHGLRMLGCVVFLFLFFIFYSMVVVVVVVNAVLCGIAESTSLTMEQAVVEDHLRVNTDHGDSCFILLLIWCKLCWWFQVKLLK